MSTLLIALALAVVCGAAWLLAKLLGLPVPGTMIVLGLLGLLGSIAWGAIELQRVGDGPGCSVCVFSPREGVLLLAGTGVGIGFLICLVGAVVWAAGRRRAGAQRMTDSARSRVE